MLECKTYRHHGHFEGDPCNYRPAGELEEWKKKDPIVLYEKKLDQRGRVDEKDIQKIGTISRKRSMRPLISPARARSPIVEELYVDILA